MKNRKIKRYKLNRKGKRNLTNLVTTIFFAFFTIYIIIGCKLLIMITFR